MNEHAIELFKQSSEEAYKLCKERGHKVGEVDSIWVSVMAATLAEVVIRKCVDIVSTTEVSYRDYRAQIEESMRNECVFHIKEYFGIKE